MILTASITEKICTVCRATKPLSEFWNAKKHPDGKQYRCKDCFRAFYRAEGQRSKKLASSRRYRKTEQGKAAFKKARTKSWLKSPEKALARNAVSANVRLGRMPKATTLPCACCGLPASQYHHHKGYSKENRLDVIPVCDPCHRKIEKENTHVK